MRDSKLAYNKIYVTVQMHAFMIKNASLQKLFTVRRKLIYQ